MGRMSVISGSGAAGIIPGAPAVIMSDYESQIARLPGLLHYIDPARLDADGNGRERFNGHRIVPKGGAVTSRIASDAGFNDLPVIRTTTGGGGLRLVPGTVTPSYTFLCVASIDAARKAAGTTSTLFDFSTATDYGGYIRMASQQVIYRSEDSDGSQNAIAAVDSPAGDVAALWGVSFDRDTMTSALIYGNGQLRIRSHGAALVPGDNYQWEYGSAGSSASSGWVGKLGEAIIIDRPYHLNTELGFFYDAMDLLKGRYGL